MSVMSATESLVILYHSPYYCVYRMLRIFVRCFCRVCGGFIRIFNLIKENVVAITVLKELHNNYNRTQWKILNVQKKTYVHTCTYIQKLMRECIECELLQV